MKIGYARIAKNDQDLKIQVDALKKFGCEKIFKDSGNSLVTRTELEIMNEQIKRGDNVVVFKLDRIAKSLSELNNLLKGYYEREINLISIQDKLDTSSLENEPMYRIVSILSNFQKELNSERIITGLEVAKKRGKGGICSNSSDI